MFFVRNVENTFLCFLCQLFCSHSSVIVRIIHHSGAFISYVEPLIPGDASPTQGSCMEIIFWHHWRWKDDPNSPFLRHLTPQRTLICRFCAIWRHWGLKNDPKSPFLYGSLSHWLHLHTFFICIYIFWVCKQKRLVYMS